MLIKINLAPTRSICQPSKNHYRRRLYNTNSWKDQNAAITNSNPTLQEKTMTVTDHDSNNSTMIGTRNSFKEYASNTTGHSNLSNKLKDVDELTKQARKGKLSQQEYIKLILGAVMEIKE